METTEVDDEDGAEAEEAPTLASAAIRSISCLFE